jgi:mRNA interferase MazF
MEKNFDQWNEAKKRLNNLPIGRFYRPGEIWWCAIGINIGSEQDGTGVNFDRPIVIIRGFNKQALFGVLLTGKKKQGTYYHYLGKIRGRDNSAILSQIRLIDSKRLIRRMGVLDKDIFKRLCEELKQILFL